ncbi:hypothetical protein V5738_10970 [Salinisphaera sp. SPP-AMP-43]|uniref:hypothetical protein n=1 Tax=Salinisphaera sp. SPP-AMP-43 TaxID=3121288 RepID=UPI003C6E8A2E
MREFLKRHHTLASVVVATTVAVAAVFLMPAIDTAGPASMSIAGLLMSAMRFAVAVAAVFLVLRALDAISDFDWKVISNDIESNPRAIALYFGLRFLAVAWIASACFS